MKIQRKSERARIAGLQAVIHLLNGRRLEIAGEAGETLYAGRSTVDRPDLYWYEHSGGRTYNETPEYVIGVLMRHVGVEAIEKAKVHPS